MVEFIGIVILILIGLPFLIMILAGLGMVVTGVLLFVGSIVKGLLHLSR